MSRKTKTEASTSPGTKTTRKKASSTSTPKTTSKRSSKTTSNVKNKKTDTSNKDTSVKTQRSLETNLRSKATSPKRQKKTTTTSGTTRQTRKSKGSVSIKPPTRSRDLTLFPHKAFPYRIEIKNEKRVAWFQCEEHAIKFLQRHHPKPFTHFKYYVFPTT